MGEEKRVRGEREKEEEEEEKKKREEKREEEEEEENNSFVAWLAVLLPILLGLPGFPRALRTARSTEEAQRARTEGVCSRPCSLACARRGGAMEAAVGEVVQDAVGRSGRGWRWRRHEGGRGQGEEEAGGSPARGPTAARPA